MSDCLDSHKLKIIDYALASKDTIEELERVIDNMLSMDWCLYGPPIITGFDSEGYTMWRYSQAMVRYENWADSDFFKGGI